MGNSQTSSIQEDLSNQTSLIQEDSPHEEIIVMQTPQEIVKNFVKEYLIVWHDANGNAMENIQEKAELQNICDLKVFTDWEEASVFIQGTQIYCHVVTSETNGELLVGKISGLANVSSISVFCRNREYHSQWAKKYKKIICVENIFQDLVSKINQFIVKWQRKDSCLRVEFPAFAPIFDELDVSDINHLHFYLIGLINFQNRAQSKRDFLTLARAISKDKHNMDDFEKTYDQYNMRSILNWYTKESFFYIVTNNCLRVATSDSIQYSRLAIKDLETAIKERYSQKSKDFHGLLYRGAYISPQEWTKLQQNVGKEIEMYGFLSTTKDKEVGLFFTEIDLTRKMLITVIVPGSPVKDEQGFAEIKEFATMEDEDEVLFNVRSRFRILEARIEEINGIQYRHLVLLYGAQAMRKFIKENNPTIQVEIRNPQQLTCYICKRNIQGLLFASLSNKNQYACSGCLVNVKSTDDSPFVSVSPSILSSSKPLLNLVFRGIMVLQHPKDLKIPFYGYKCTKCGKSKFNFAFKCVICREPTKTWCDECLSGFKGCVQLGHIVILETRPFSFWSEIMSEKELSNLKNEKESLSGFSHPFLKANMFFSTHEYKKAIQYYEVFLKQSGNTHNKYTAVAYDYIGLAYKGLGKYKEAIKYYLEALKIRKSLFGEKHENLATTYSSLGLAYENLKEYDKAIEAFSNTIEIMKLANKTSDEALGQAYHHLGEIYHRAFGSNEEAMDCFLNALESYESLDGKACSYHGLGSIYESLNQNEEALECYLHALGLVKSSGIGDKDSDVAAFYNSLGSVYEKLEQYDKALENRLYALKLLRLIYGDKHPDTGKLYLMVGRLYGILQDFHKGREHLSIAFEILKAENHPDAKTAFEALTVVNQYFERNNTPKEKKEKKENEENLHEIVIGNKLYKFRWAVPKEDRKPTDVEAVKKMFSLYLENQQNLQGRQTSNSETGEPPSEQR